MEKIFKSIYERLSQGQSLILASIIAASGSTPRGAGAKMLVFEDGTTEGTIGGGRVEYLCRLKAADAIRQGKSLIFSYDLSQSDIAGVGMICGGRVEVCFKHFTAKELELAAYLNFLIDRQETSWLITRIRGACVDIGTYDRINGVRFIDGIDKAEEWLDKKYSFEYEDSRIFIEPFIKKGRVYIFGAGHVSRQLAPLLEHIGFKVAVFEQRRELIEDFPRQIGVIDGRFKNIAERIKLDKEDYAVIMTSGHSADFDVLEQVLRQDLSYVGVIGSRSKIAATRAKLIGCGISEEKIDSLHTPIGLPIGARTPEEIAVSVAAELILHRAERQ